MKLYQYSINLIDIPPKNVSVIGSKIQLSIKDASLIGEIISYDRKNNIAKIQLYEALDFKVFPKQAQNKMIDVKYTNNKKV